MTQQQAVNTLLKSLQNLQHRKGQLTIDQVEAEVINLSCLEILKSRQHLRATEITEMFTSAAKQLIPAYTDQRAMVATFGVMQNIGWDGMWDFLKNYFLSNHGINIDDTAADSIIFYSARHERYENNIMVADTPADRNIDLFFTNEKQVVTVNIMPTLSPKKATLIDVRGSNYIYRGTDPDYKFTVCFDEIGEVTKFILEMPNRMLRIEYLEY